MIALQLKNIQKVFTLILFILFCAVVLQSCFSSGSHRRGKLSDAMGKASDDNKGDRKVDTEPDPEPEPVIIVEKEEDHERLEVNTNHMQQLSADTLNYESNPDRQDNLPESGFKLKPKWLSIMGGTGLMKGETFYGLNHFNLSIGGYHSEHNRIDFSAGFGWAPVQKTSSLKKSLKGGVTLLNLGLDIKLFTTPTYTFLGQYFNFGIKYNYMFWSYKNSIIADTYDENGNVSGTEKISRDGLSGIEFFAGLGIHLIQTSAFQIGAEVSPGVIFWLGETTKGFENDVFSTFWYTKFKVIINFRTI